jgi:hypothetical protein
MGMEFVTKKLIPTEFFISIYNLDGKTVIHQRFDDNECLVNTSIFEDVQNFMTVTSVSGVFIAKFNLLRV